MTDGQGGGGKPAVGIRSLTALGNKVYFSYDDGTHGRELWAAGWIERLAAEGVTTGCGNGNYCPDQAVSRAEMAVFLTRMFNLPLP